MRIAVYPVARARPYAEALAAAGHQIVAGPENGGGPADVLLTDFDQAHHPHATFLRRYADWGARIFQYPHGAGLLTAWDGIHPVSSEIAAHFVLGEGQAEVMRRYGYPVPTHPIGWPFGRLRPFRPCEAPRRVLFAPWHPLEDWYMVPAYLEANRAAFAELVAAPGIELTVRHIGPLEVNGLWEAPGVRFVRGQMDGSTAELPGADAVVTNEGTYAYLAMAHGVPTVLYGQDVQPRDTVRREDGSYAELGVAASWGAYRDYARYPFCLGDRPLGELLHAAAADEAATHDYRRRFMGEEWDPGAFVELVESLCAIEPGEAYEGRAVSVVALAHEVLALPALLRGYAAAFGPEDDATLVLVEAGTIDQALVERATEALIAAGLSDDVAPDIVLAPVPIDPVERRALARRASAVLSEAQPPDWLAGLPRYGADGTAALRRIAEERWAA